MNSNNTTTPFQRWWNETKHNLATFQSQDFRYQLKVLLTIKKSPAAIAKIFLFTIGSVLTFLSFIGALLGYVRGYNIFMRPDDELPRLHKLPLIVKVSMLIGGVVVWLLLLVIGMWLFAERGRNIQEHIGIIIFLVVNFVLSLAVYFVFRRWRNGVHNLKMEKTQFASAYWAGYEDLKGYYGKKGFYIGGPLTFSDKGHMLVFAPSRSGKGVNLLIPNILGVGGFKGSHVIIDPKGEILGITRRYLISQGKRVIVLNPWELLGSLIPQNDCYNPLSILSDKGSIHLVDDVAVLAEMIVPVNDADHNKYFSDSARNMIATLLLHLVVSVENPTLGILWEWCRLSGDDWNNLLADMAVSDDYVNGEVIRLGASEIAKQMGSPETFSSILGNVLESTSFIKSKVLRNALEDGFDPYSITDGNTYVFIVVPVEKLRSHSRYLRLTVVSLMRAIVRRPSKTNRVAFILDEAASLGKIDEIETALAAYAGFNISLMLVFQDLSQMHYLYGDKFESVIANSAVRIFFSVRDNFTAEYVSRAIGTTTHTLYKKDWMGNVSDIKTNSRELATMDEVRRMSDTQLIIFTGENPAARFPKFPYYLMPELKRNGKPVYDNNPYLEEDVTNVEA